MSEFEKSVDFWVDELTHDINPEHFNHHENFIPHMHDEKISSFGNWMWNNGYNVGLVNLQTKVNTYCVPQWISVKERLPKKSGIYLVYGKRGSGKTAIDTADFAVHQGCFSLWNFTVTHWMFLPELPKENNNE